MILLLCQECFNLPELVDFNQVALSESQFASCGQAAELRAPVVSKC